jgi:hypothetical protein
MSIARSERVSRELAERKRLFRVALANAGMTAGEWGEANDTDPAYLSRYLGGKTASQPLGAKIDAFIAKHMRQLSRTA